MISGIVAFEEIVQSVKDETGISNMRPYYEKIRRFIFRGEREIGYGGTVELKKKTFLVSGVTNINCGFGKYFKFPEDFIEFEGVGRDCCPVSECEYRATSEGIRFHKKQSKDIVLLYWGLQTDDQGYPLVTRNHEEAVIAFIVWKLYTPNIFLGIGNMNAKKDYENTFNSFLLEARGDDAFPTLEQWNALGQLSYTDRRLLIDQPVHYYDYCAEYESPICSQDETQLAAKMIKFWQQNSFESKEEIYALINQSFLNDKPQLPFETFELGYEVDYTNVGRICFAIAKSTDYNYVLRDFMNNIVNNAFDEYYFEDLEVKVYISKNIIIPSKILTKIQNQ